MYVHSTDPNFGELFIPVRPFYQSYFIDLLYLYVHSSGTSILPVLFPKPLYTCTSILAIRPFYRSYFLTSLYLYVHSTGPTLVKLSIPIRPFYQSHFLELIIYCTSILPIL